MLETVHVTAKRLKNFGLRLSVSLMMMMMMINGDDDDDNDHHHEIIIIIIVTGNFLAALKLNSADTCRT